MVFAKPPIVSSISRIRRSMLAVPTFLFFSSSILLNLHWFCSINGDEFIFTSLNSICSIQTENIRRLIVLVLVVLTTKISALECNKLNLNKWNLSLCFFRDARSCENVLQTCPAIHERLAKAFCINLASCYFIFGLVLFVFWSFAISQFFCVRVVFVFVSSLAKSFRHIKQQIPTTLYLFVAYLSSWRNQNFLVLSHTPQTLFVGVLLYAISLHRLVFDIIDTNH